MITAELLEDLVCPACRSAIVASDDAAVACTGCSSEYPVRSGIPILVHPNLQRREMESQGRPSHKAQQMAFFDQDPGDEFGVVRPRTAPELYERLLREKFRRSIIGLQELLPGATVLVICGGSGLDAEFLVETGARVILSDISLGVVLQARERSRRFGLRLELLVADAEALPFPDGAVDVVYVHDGLHHLERPELGLAEMARVARCAVSVSEPASSFATAVAMRLGWAAAREEAGNPVARLTLDQVVNQLGKRGFRPIQPHRYAMFYRHWPGRLMGGLSRPIALRLTLACLALANRTLGRYGNKLTVQAVRVDE